MLEIEDSRLFLQDREYYKRDIDPIGHYIEQSGIYLSKMTGDSIDLCKSWISDSLRNKKIEGMVDPVVKFFHREDGGDKVIEETPLSRYINHTVSQGLILAPTFTCYVNPYKKESKLAGFIDGNVKKRGKAKKEAFVAKNNGDTLKFIMKNNEQNNMKTYNNSLSGTFGSKGSVLYNPTGHSTLTSIIRSVSSFGNASNERIVMGNRHFYDPDIVMHNLITVCQLTDRNTVKDVLERYQLHIPDIEDVIACIQHSSDFYWRDSRVLDRLREFISKMDDIERASFVYNGDLYHIRKHNDAFMREFIDALSLKCNYPVENALEVVGKIDEQIINYAHQVCFDDAMGLGKDYKKMQELGKLNTIVATALNITKILREYQPLIRGLFLSKLVPASHAYIPSMMRRAVVLSDTDSTCFSVDDWMFWYFGGIHFSEKTYAVCGAVAFIANQSVGHALAILSANINTTTDNLHALAMKNEFLWSVHMPTNVAKHYAAWTVMQEGNVFKKPELEVKGVHLKNSAAPPVLIKRSHEMIKEILQTLYSNQKIDIFKYVKEIQDIERDIIESVTKGEITYLKTSKIKDAEAYTKSEEESPYQHYQLWLDVFQDKYGVIDPPPYSVVKIPTILGSKTKLKAWISGMDEDIGTRMNTWLTRMGKTSLNTMYLSIPYVGSYGIPKEISMVLDSRSIVLDLTIVFRIILESLGFFLKDGVLVSDYKL